MSRLPYSHPGPSWPPPPFREGMTAVAALAAIGIPQIRPGVQLLWPGCSPPAASSRRSWPLLDLVAGHTASTHPWFTAAAHDPGDHRYIWADPGPDGGRLPEGFVRSPNSGWMARESSS